MAQNVEINGVVYQNVPSVRIPNTGGTASYFYDTTGANISAADIRNGNRGYGANGELTGSMTEKSAASYNPSSSDQTITANQYLAGTQTIKAVTTSNLQAQYIANGVTVKVGCTADDDCIASVTGTLTSPTVQQDSTTKVLSIQ